MSRNGRGETELASLIGMSPAKNLEKKRAIRGGKTPRFVFFSVF